MNKETQRDKHNPTLEGKWCKIATFSKQLVQAQVCTIKPQIISEKEHLWSERKNPGCLSRRRVPGF